MKCKIVLNSIWQACTWQTSIPYKTSLKGFQKKSFLALFCVVHGFEYLYFLNHSLYSSFYKVDFSFLWLLYFFILLLLSFLSLSFLFWLFFLYLSCFDSSLFYHSLQVLGLGSCRGLYKRCHPSPAPDLHHRPRWDLIIRNQ